MKIRKYREEDCASIAELFYKSVHHISHEDYNEEQLNAWATGNIEIEKWNMSFLENYTIVIEEEDIIVGFSDITSLGYLDHLYVHPQYLRKGVATKLVDEIELFAFSNKLEIVETHASITAKSFFEKRGYKCINKNTVIRNNVALTNYTMTKKIDMK